MDDSPYHAHIYFRPEERISAAMLHERFGRHPAILFVGAMIDRAIGPHPMAQFEIHFRARFAEDIIALIEPTNLRALIHPLTEDDFADHTSLAHWIGTPLTLDLSVLDPPGRNKGLARFGRRDF